MPRHYFAYGSNMDPEQFRSRCPESRVLGPATLAHHRFFITARGYASIEPRVGGLVHGVLAELTEADEAALDSFEGVRHCIYRKESMVVAWDGGEVAALAYVDNETELGQPKPGYLERVIRGARTDVQALKKARISHGSGLVRALSPAAGGSGEDLLPWVLVVSDRVRRRRMSADKLLLSLLLSAWEGA